MSAVQNKIPEEATEESFGRMEIERKTYMPLDTVTVHITGRKKGDSRCTIRVCDTEQKQYAELYVR